MRYSAEAAPRCAHIGQLKLLLSEIEFLTPYYGRSLHVIYAGAAPGVHIPILAQMFPTMRFVLVDPARSMISNGEYTNIEVIQDFMSEALASEFAAKFSSDSLLFISDIRVGAPGNGETDEEQQFRIQRDMDAQRWWVKRMHPLSSILKFRLPWSIGAKTNYLGGKIYLPVYGKCLTHEARLIVPRDAPAMEFDNRRYERQMSYFNRVLRPALQPAFGGGRCYDCTAFRWIVCKYLAASEGYDVGSANDNYSAINRMCRRIERTLDELKRVWLASGSGVHND